MKLGRTRSNCTFENDFVFVLFKARRNRPVQKKHQKRPGMTICALSNTSCQLVRRSAAQKLSGVFHSGNKNHRAQGHVPVRTRLKIFHDVLKNIWLYSNYDCVCDIDNKYILAMNWTPCGPGSCVHLDWSEKMSSRKLVPFHQGIYIRKSNCDRKLEGVPFRLCQTPGQVLISNIVSKWVVRLFLKIKLFIYFWQGNKIGMTHDRFSNIFRPSPLSSLIEHFCPEANQTPNNVVLSLLYLL